MEYRHANPQSESQKIDACPFKRQTRLQIELSGRPRKAICSAIGADQPQLSRWEHDSCPPTIPGHLLPAWTREVGPGLLAWICREAGYDLLATDSASIATSDPVALVALLSRQSGAAVAETMTDIASDGVWTPEEKTEALHRFQRLQALVNGIVDALQAQGAKGEVAA